MAANRDEERVLWRSGKIECVMISCCTGAELQVRRTTEGSDDAGDPGAPGDIVLRELYPTKSDLYERARDLREELGGSKEEA